METMRTIFNFAVEHSNGIMLIVYLSVFVLMAVALVVSWFQIRKWKKEEQNSHNEWLKWRNLAADRYKEMQTLTHLRKTAEALLDDFKQKFFKAEGDYESLLDFKNKSDKGFRAHIAELKNGLRLKALQQAVIISRKHYMEHVNQIYSYISNCK